MHSGTLTITSNKHMELVDITTMIDEQLKKSGINNGSILLYNPHTTAGLTINEGADPAVKEDIIAGFRHMVPLDYPFKHMEGNSPSHIMASLMGCSLTVIIEKNQLVLGTWQRIFFCEFDGPRSRRLKFQITSNQ
jgi:secondary thiamine-phosphate synthase enzyme